MSRVVLDTNIIVSALLQPLGIPARVLVLALGGAIEMCISAAVYSEYEEVISRPRFSRSAEVISGALRAIRESSIWVRPSETVQACSDPDDDMFLECAEAAPRCVSGHRQSQTLSTVLERNQGRDGQAVDRAHARRKQPSLSPVF
jgi:putative PIN family toxin of toxin-antitoxin system